MMFLIVFCMFNKIQGGHGKSMRRFFLKDMMALKRTNIRLKSELMLQCVVSLLFAVCNDELSTSASSELAQLGLKSVVLFTLGRCMCSDEIPERLQAVQLELIVFFEGNALDTFLPCTSCLG